MVGDGAVAAGAGSERPVIICFAGDAWDGNPHSRHHLMRRFAGRYEVLFVEQVPMRSLAAGDRHEWRRVLGKLRGRAGVRTVAPHLHVLRPLPVPPTGAIGRRAQLDTLRVHIAITLRRLGLTGRRISWFSLPIVAPLRGRLGERASLFYYQDRYHAFSHVDTARLKAQVAALARGCDACLTTGENLAGELRALGVDPIVVPHGVDAERFGGEHVRPPDLRGLEEPLIGYVGIVDDFVSFDRLWAVADRLEEGTVVLVGPVNTDVTALEHPRIRLLGPKPYESIPGYLTAFACCLVPFELNELTVAINPIKLREYLAAGRPVVSTSLPEVAPYADVVALAERPEELAEAVVESLRPGNDDEESRRRRRERVAAESWDRVAEGIERTLSSLLTAGAA